jgi:hypothetical protein
VTTEEATLPAFLAANRGRFSEVQVVRQARPEQHQAEVHVLRCKREPTGEPS